MAGIRVGNAPVSWGVYEAHLPNPPFAQVLDAIAAAGYEGTELGPYGYLPTEPSQLARELTTRKLALGSSFVSMILADPAKRAECVEQALKVGRLLATQGVTEVICADAEDAARHAMAGRVPRDGSCGHDDRAWAEVVTTLHAVAKALRKELKMKVVVHHHAGTYIETTDEIDRLLAGTDPELVNLLLDTGHAVYGGADPVDLLKRHGKRITYVHYKDVKPAELEHVRSSQISMPDAWKRGVFSPLGEGMVDFPGVTEALRGLGYAGWVIVEQDVVADAQGKLVPEPVASARQSRKFLRDRLGL